MGASGRIVYAIGFYSSLMYFVSSLRKHWAKRISLEKLKLINEALEQSEERILRLQERHDRLLSQMCSYYLCHKELEEALVCARKAVNEELECASGLRKMQLWVLSCYPDAIDLANALS